MSSPAQPLGKPPGYNPFEHPGTTATAVTPERVGASEHVDKPWGHEEIFAVLDGHYVGKILSIRAGMSLSLQRHTVKNETIAVQSGQVTVECGPDAEHLQTVTLRAGQHLLIRARTVHRITAVVDSRLLEASTAAPGWRTDVVRLEDRYGREGTSAP